MIQVPTMRKN